MTFFKERDIFQNENNPKLKNPENIRFFFSKN